MDRPRQFRINYGHPLARGLVFAGLGGPAGVGSSLYQDSSLYRNNGTLTNMDPATDWVWDRFLGRWVLDYDVTNDAVALPAVFGTLDSGNAWTISIWHKCTGIVSYGGLITAGCTGLAQTRSAGYYGLLRTGAGFVDVVQVSATPEVAGKWLNVCAVVNGAPSGPPDANANIYINGKLTNGAFAGDGNYNVHNTIGQGYASANGQIGDPMIWCRALSTSELSIFADPSNTMLGGLLMPPKRRYYRIGGGTYHGYPTMDTIPTMGTI